MLHLVSFATLCQALEMRGTDSFCFVSSLLPNASSKLFTLRSHRSAHVTRSWHDWDPFHVNNTNNTNNCISVPQSAFQSVDNPMRRTSFVTGISIESSSVILIIGSLPGSEAEFRFKSAVLWNMAIAWYTLNDLIHPDSLWHAEFQVFSTCPNFGAVWAMPSFVKWSPFIVQARLTGLSLSKHRNIQLRCWHVLASMLSIRLHKIIMVLLPCFCLFPTVFAVYNSSAKQIHWSHPNLPLNFQSHMKLSPHTSPKSPQLHRL